GKGSQAGGGRERGKGKEGREKMGCLESKESAPLVANEAAAAPAKAAEAVQEEEAAGEYDDFLAKAAKIRVSHPDNLCAKFLTPELFYSFSEEDQAILYKCAITGIDNPDSVTGCYAMTATDYERLAPFFDQVIQGYHKPESKNAKHVTDWDASDVGDNGVLDVTELGLDELSMRVRVGRNLTSFNLPGNMDREERIEFEKTMLKAFEKLIDMPEYGGKVYSLTPDFGEGEANPNLISKSKYQELVDAHIMFKDMAADPYLASAGIANDWPYGRGCYVSDDGQFIIWFGEEDQLRIMCMKKGSKLNEVFDRLHEGLQVVESIDGIDFATSDRYGYVTSCPTNLGTGMRASVHIKIPNLTADGTDKKAKEICKPLGLSVRGTGGEHTPIGADGTVDISPSKRLFIKEKEIIEKLYNGIQALMEIENAQE
ncbi:Arginine kinase (AK), partial [Durusdinium trenchii]